MLDLTQVLGKLLKVAPSVQGWQMIRVPFSGLLCLPPYLSLSSAEIASTFVVVKTDVVEGARSSAFLFVPLLHLSHSGTFPVSGKHQGTQLWLQSRDNGPARDELHPERELGEED